MHSRGLGVLLLTSWYGVTAGSWTFAQDTLPNTLLAQARPHLEAVLGRRLEEPQRLRVATFAELLRVPDTELAVQIAWQFPDLHGERALATAFRAAKEVSRSATAALHDPRTGEILVVPDAGKQMAAWNVALARTDSPAFLQLAIVFAQAERYLDTTYHVGPRWQQCRDVEEFQILQTVRAGRALCLTQKVAKRLGNDSYLPLLVQRFRYVPEGNRENALKHVCQETLRRRYTAAVEGLALCEYLDEQRLPDLERRLFEQPPRQLAWLARPELYVNALQSGGPGLAEALRRLESSLPGANWSVSQQPWTPAMVRQAAALLGQQKQADKALRGWNEARTLVWADKHDPNKQVALSVVRFETESAARGYFDFANEMQRKRDVASNAPDAGMLRVLEARMNACTLATAIECIRFEKVLQLDPKAAPLTEKKVLARCGDKVVEVAWYGIPDDLAWAERSLAALVKP